MKRVTKIIALLALGLVALYLTVLQAQDLLNNDDPGEREVVVLLHGLARSNAAMWLLNLRLQRAGYHVESIGYSSLNQTPEDIQAQIRRQIDSCCLALNKPVHLVGHSLGGLLIRAYLQENRLRNLGRVVLIGTPNQGTALADYYRDKWWVALAGPTALALGTGEESFPLSLAPPYYPVGIIAGIGAKQMDDRILPGPDDGLVSVASTRLNGMQDFILVDSGHSMLRYDETVANQTIHFLQRGHFEKRETADTKDRPGATR